MVLPATSIKLKIDQRVGAGLLESEFLTDAVVFQLKICQSLLVQTGYSKKYDDHLANWSVSTIFMVPFFKGGQH